MGCATVCVASFAYLPWGHRIINVLVCAKQLLHVIIHLNACPWIISKLTYDTSDKS